MAQKLLIKNALLVTLNPEMAVFSGDILIEDRHIKDIALNIQADADELFDATGMCCLPGFVQTHVHLCQTLYRNFADDLLLLDWLYKKILPYEAKHTEQTMRASAALGIAELIRCGTTTILDFGSVNHQDVVFDQLARAGMRAIAGKCLIDMGNGPAGLTEKTSESLQQSERLMNRWHGYDDYRLQYAVTPRFMLTCSDELLKESARMARSNGILLHSHAAENKKETELVTERFGCGNIAAFEKLDMAGPNLALAHCIWTTPSEKRILRENGIKVLHCPSANLKLGSGIAPVPEYLQNGISVSLGADGAPCNNNLDIFNEMRLAALIQKPIHGPDVLPAREVLKMATIYGARALGLDDRIGSLEPGKLADLTFIKLDQVHSIPYENIYSKLVYSARSTDVHSVLINGQWVLKDRRLTTLDEQQIIKDAQESIAHFG